MQQLTALWTDSNYGDLATRNIGEYRTGYPPMEQ